MKRTTKSQTPIERFMALSKAEKELEVGEFDQEFVADTFHPLTPVQKKRWQRMRKKMGRPKIGRGARVISITIEASLLARADAQARREKLTRAALFARALESDLSKAG